MTSSHSTAAASVSSISTVHVQDQDGTINTVIKGSEWVFNSVTQKFYKWDEVRGLYVMARIHTEAPYIQGSETSKAAAVDIGKSRDTLRAKVLCFLTLYGPSTDEEIQRGLPMNPSTQRPRRVELVQQGLVRETDTKRRTLSGRFATVWEAV